MTFSFAGGLFAVTVIEAVFDVCVDGSGLWFESIFDSFRVPGWAYTDLRFVGGALVRCGRFRRLTGLGSGVSNPLV